MARASRSKRSEKASLESLMATTRSRRVSRALHTSPMPPAPIGFRISYGPRRDPDARGIDLEFYFKLKAEPIGRPLGDLGVGATRSFPCRWTGEWSGLVLRLEPQVDRDQIVRVGELANRSCHIAFLQGSRTQS